MELFLKLRKQLDAYSQLVGEMKPLKNIGVSTSLQDFNSDKATFELVGFPEYTISKPLQTCTDNLLLAKAWCGTLLGQLGGESPYKNDGQRTDVKHIEPTDAKADVAGWKERNNWKAKTHVEQVDNLRQLIQGALDTVQGFFPEKDLEVKNPRTFAIARTEIETHLIEARFQLGFEMQRLKEESEAPAVDYNTPLYGGIKQK